MFGLSHIDRLSRLMDVAALDAQVHAANLANQNTPGYRSKAVSFEEAFQDAIARGDDQAADALEPQVVEPRATPVSVDGNDVDPDREILLMADNPYSDLVAIARGKMRIMGTAISPVP